MIDIDYIMELIDWNNSNDNQMKGIELAQEVKCISVFLQPGSPYGKNVWDNCARILYKKTDAELSPYLIDLLEWLQDLNWPGALCIFERLKKYTDEVSYSLAVHICLKYARALNDNVWEGNLRRLKEN